MISSSELRAHILELLHDYKLHTTMEIRDFLDNQKGQVYKKDYTRGQLSGVLYALVQNGICSNEERGKYLLNKSVQKPESKQKKISKANSGRQFASFYIRAQRDVSKLIYKLKAGFEEIRLSDVSSTECENANLLMQLIENLEAFCEKDVNRQK